MKTLGKISLLEKNEQIILLSRIYGRNKNTAYDTVYLDCAKMEQR